MRDFSGTPGAAGDPNHYHGEEFGSTAPHDTYAAHGEEAFDPSHYPAGPGGAGSSAAHAALPFEDLGAGGYQVPPAAGQHSVGPEGAGSSAAHAALPLGLPPSRLVSAAQALDELPPPELPRFMALEPRRSRVPPKLDAPSTPPLPPADKVPPTLHNAAGQEQWTERAEGNEGKSTTQQPRHAE